MTKFRYRILDIKWMGQHSKIEAVLNEAGDEGWEAIDLRWNAGSHDFVTVTMRQTTPETGVAQVNQFMWEHRDGRVVALPEGAQPGWPTDDWRLIAGPGMATTPYTARKVVERGQQPGTLDSQEQSETFLPSGGSAPYPARTQAPLPGNYKTQPSSQGGGQAVGPALNLSPPAPVDTSDA